MYSLYSEKEKKLDRFGGNYDTYISMIKKAYLESKTKLSKIKKMYILDNPFMTLEDKTFYLGYVHFSTKRDKLVNKFISILSNKVKKRNRILGRFVNIVKYNILKNKKPCNDVDIFSAEPYNKNNKNIYLRDIKNSSVWFFEIETIIKTLAGNLSYFDTETYDVLCKDPINPFTNNNLNTGQLISLYEQLYNYKCIPHIFMLFRIANFDTDRFLLIYNNNIIDYSYKFNIGSLYNPVLLSMLLNIFIDNNMDYLNLNKLDITNENTKNDIIDLIKNCNLTYKNRNHKRHIRIFVKKHSYIIRRARRDFSDSTDDISVDDGINENDENDLDYDENDDPDYDENDLDYNENDDLESISFSDLDEIETDFKMQAVNYINAVIKGYNVRKINKKNKMYKEKWEKILLDYISKTEDIILNMDELKLDD